MKSINELKEIAVNRQKYIGSNELEIAIIKYYQDDIAPLINLFSSMEANLGIWLLRSLCMIDDEITGKMSTFGEETDFDDMRVEDLLMDTRIISIIPSSDIELLRQRNILTLKVKLISHADRFGVDVYKRKSMITQLFDKKVQDITKKSVNKIVNIKNNAAMIGVAVLGLNISACAKIVHNKDNSNLVRSPGISVPVDENSGTIDLAFANHSVSDLEADELTSYEFEENLLVLVPKSIDKITFQNARNHPTLTLTANNEYVCSYIWVPAGQSNPNVVEADVRERGEYRMHKSCAMEMEVDNQLAISVQSVPKGQTVSLKFHWEK